MFFLNYLLEIAETEVVEKSNGMHLNIKSAPFVHYQVQYHNYYGNGGPQSRVTGTRGVKKRIRTFGVSIIEFGNSYCQQSGIHGMSYLAKSELHWIERLVWFLLLILSVVGCTIIALESVDRFFYKSTIIGLECDYQYWNTSVPSLTVCPLKRLDMNLFNDFCYENRIKGIEKEELFLFLEALANTTYTNSENIPEYDSVDKTLNDLDIHPAEYMSLIYNLTLDLAIVKNNTIRVNFKHFTDNVTVRQVLTEFGICYIGGTYLNRKYSANYFIHGEYPEEYKSDDDDVTYMDTLQCDYFTSRMSVMFQGYTSNIYAYVHSPYDTMRVDSFYSYVDDGLAFLTEVQEVLADEEFQRATTPEQRKCRFQDESNLQNFPIYTKNFCMQQCRLNEAHRLCNCIPHFYPNRGRNPKPVCNYRQLKKCFTKNADYLLKLYRPNTRIRANCPCVRGCQDSFVRLLKKTNIVKTGGLMSGKFTTLNIINPAHRRYRRQIIFTFTDLLVSIGGTAGLFLGFSVLGAIEFAYFITIRLFFRCAGRKL